MAAALRRVDVVLTPFPFTDLAGSSLRPALVVSQGAVGRDVVRAGISSVVRGRVRPHGLYGRHQPSGIPPDRPACYFCRADAQTGGRRDLRDRPPSGADWPFDPGRGGSAVTPGAWALTTLPWCGSRTG